MSEGPRNGATSSGATVRLDLSDTVYRGFVRREEALPEDCEEYKAGCEIENRKRPPPPELPGDAFDRQRVISGFDQSVIERQVCLVLGTGGLGMDVAFTLARLGVARIILVDRDTYDASNLTRQCLAGKADIGMRKVDVAARTLREHHSIRSEVETLHCDAVLEWPRIVEAARRATVVFNGVDVGVAWDFAVNALCKELALPLACGQSFAWKFMAEFYTGSGDEVCAFCHDSLLSTFGASSEAAVRRKGGPLERLEAFLASRRAPGAGPDHDLVGANVLAAFLAGDKQFRISGSSLCGDVVATALRRTACREGLRPGQELGSDLLAFLRALHDESVERLRPGSISSLSDLAFIPRPAHADTRWFGSWICPCFGCAIIMVSQWAAWLTSEPPEEQQDGAPPPLRNPPQMVTFNLNVGMTGEEQLGYEFGQLGMPLDKAERRFCREACNMQCAVCSAASTLRAEESLFVGRLPVALSRSPGTASPCPATWRDLPAKGSAEYSVAAARALGRRSPLAPLGEDYASAVLPAMPALDWECGGSTSSAAPGEPAVSPAAPSPWPPELSLMPLLKVPLDSPASAEPSVLRGIASGVRSALVKARGRWWRLKGCGNRDEGFPLEAKGDKGEVNVRGSCFKHTVDAELRMSQLAGQALAAAGLDIANIPAGLYHYECAPSWPLPKIERYCGVFETLGNARLGDHLLGGLLKIVPHLLPGPAPGGGFPTLPPAIAAGRGAEAGDLWPTETVASCGLPTADVAKQLALAGVTWLGEVQPQLPEASRNEIPADIAVVWDRATAALGTRLAELRATTREPSLLLWLCWRLGWECGATVRALHSAHIAWGTYPDAMGIHCNAHVNNLVVKPPGVGRSTTFLAALDFDMAFTREGFLPEASESHAGMGLNTWEGVLSFEATMGMKTVLAGSDFCNTGVANATAVPSSHTHVEMALRDTLVTAYEAALAGGEDAHPHDDALRRAADELLKLALCLTTQVES